MFFPEHLIKLRPEKITIKFLFKKTYSDRKQHNEIPHKEFIIIFYFLKSIKMANLLFISEMAKKSL